MFENDVSRANELLGGLLNLKRQNTMIVSIIQKMGFTMGQGIERSR